MSGPEMLMATGPVDLTFLYNYGAFDQERLNASPFRRFLASSLH